METNIAIVRPKEVVNNPIIAKTMEHLITVTHSDNVSSDEVIGMLRSAFTCYTLEKRTNCSSDIQMTLEQAYNYIKKYRFTIKTKKVTFIPYWTVICTVTLPCKPFYPSVSKMYENKTFLNKSIFNRKGLLELLGDEYRIEPVKDQYSTDSYQINAVIKLDEQGDDALKTYKILVQKQQSEITEVESEDTF